MPSESTLEVVAKALCEKFGFIYVAYIDAGKFKETYHVIRDKTDLALKICKPEGVSERTSREIDAMRKFDNPNIVKLHDIGTFFHGGISYIFLLEEFLYGGSLSKAIETTPLSMESLKQVSLQMVDALIDLKHVGIVHRDIKPDNIMFRDIEKTQAVLVDFGLVRILAQDSLTQTFFMRGPGTPMFASPEQLNNEKELIDWRSDQFSLGVTLYYAYYKRLPFSEDIAKHVDAVAMRQKLPMDISQKLSADGLSPLTKMLARYPVERYVNPAILQEELRRVVC